MAKNLYPSLRHRVWPTTGYRAQVTDSPVGQADNDFRLPFSPAELEKFGVGTGQFKADPAALKDFGWRLFNSVFAGPLQTNLRNSLNEAYSQGTGLRLRLNLAKAPALAQLPWEYLYFPPFDCFFALLKDVVLVRHAPLPGGANNAPLAIDPPLKVLVALPDPFDYAPSDSEQYWARLQLALDDLQRSGLLVLERLEQPTFTALQQKLSVGGYHTLHFMGHSDPSYDANAPATVWENESGQSEAISAGQLAKVLKAAPSLRLALLDASTATGDPSFAGMAGQLELAAVLVTQFELSDEATLLLTNAFYRALVSNWQKVDIALSQARNAIFDSGNDVAWASAALYLAGQDSQIFTVGSLSPNKQLASLEREIQAALEQEDWARAIAKLEQLLALDPNLAEAKTQLEQARSQQELATMYATGQQQAGAGQWYEALETFRKVQGLNPTYRDLPQQLETAEKEGRRVRLAEASEATEREDWATAIAKLEQLLTLDPGQEEVIDQLEAVKQQQELAALYATGQAQYAAGEWCEALDTFVQVENRAGNYKAVKALIRVSDEECRRAQIQQLPSEIQAALDQQDWGVAAQKLQRLLSLNPLQEGAAQILAIAQVHARQTTLYQTAQQHYQAGRLIEALAALHEVQSLESSVQPPALEMGTRPGLQAGPEREAGTETQAEPGVAPQTETWADIQAEAETEAEPGAAPQTETGTEVEAQTQTALDPDGSQLRTPNYGLPTTDSGLPTIEIGGFRLRTLDSGLPTAALIAEIEGKLAQEKTQEEAAVLYAEAEEAAAREDWAAAIVKLQSLLALNPQYAEAESKLAQAQAQQELATLYANGQRSYKASHWHEALRYFRQLQQRAGNYKESEPLIAEIDAKLKEITANEQNYLDFEVELQRTPQGYRAEILNSPAGQATNNFRLPFTWDELATLQATLKQPGQKERKLAAVKDFGWRLFNSVFGGEIDDYLGRSLALSDRRGNGLRIKLRLNLVPELAELPWEYLYYPPLNTFLALLSKTTLVRYLETPALREPTPVDPPLNVLVVISNPANYTHFETEWEWARLNDALGDLQAGGLLTLDRLDFSARTTLAEVQKKLWWGKYSVLHFIGHGYFDQFASDGMLVLEDETGQGQPVAGTELAKLLHEHETLRLVVLNACEGAGQDAQTGFFGGVARSLVEQGVTAAVAMQFEVSDEASTRRDAAFYSALTQGQPVDLALSMGRSAVFDSSNDVDWGTSLLYQNSPNGRIFNVAPLSLEQQIAVLNRQALAAVARDEWEVLVEKLRLLIIEDPSKQPVLDSIIEARQHQEIGTLYATGRRHYEAGHWCQALDCLRQVQQQGGTFKDLETLIGITEEECNKVQLGLLQQEGQAALAQEDWPTAIQRLEEVLAINPTQEGVAEQLAQARRHQSVIALYETGLTEYRAGRWQTALTAFRQLQTGGDPRYVQESLKITAEIEAKLDQERKKQEIDQLYDEVYAAIDREDWAAAFEKLANFTALSPEEADSAAQLSNLTRERQEQAILYITGQEHFKGGRWQESLEAFRQLQSRAGSNYKDVAVLIPEAEARQAQEIDQIESGEPARQPYGDPLWNSFFGDPASGAPPSSLPDGPPPVIQSRVGNAYGASPESRVQRQMQGAPISQAQAAPREPGGIGLPVRVFWFIFIGWWLGFFWVAAGYFLAVSLILLPLGLVMHKRLPQVLTLRPVTPEAPGPNPVTVHPIQYNWFLRVLYFIFIGWWLGGLWSLCGYFLCLFIVSEAAGTTMLGRLPQILILRRTYDEAAAKAQGYNPPYFAPQPMERTSIYLIILVLAWLLIPIALVVLFIISNVVK